MFGLANACVVCGTYVQYNESMIVKKYIYQEVHFWGRREGGISNEFSHIKSHRMPVSKT